MSVYKYFDYWGKRIFVKLTSATDTGKVSHLGHGDYEKLWRITGVDAEGNNHVEEYTGDRNPMIPDTSHPLYAQSNIYYTNEINERIKEKEKEINKLKKDLEFIRKNG